MNTPLAQQFETMPDDDYATRNSGLDVNRITDSIRNLATVSEALRVLGAAVIVASMSLFLLQGWSEGNDIRRYMLLLSQTVLLTVAGFALSHGLKEPKGARLFFGLSLMSVPANFTILSALVYSVVQWDGSLTSYPSYAHWQIENVASTGVTLGGAMIVLLPITLFCFAVMARHSTKMLAPHFFLLNLLLLLPIRSSIAAGAIALLGTIYALWVVRQAIPKDKALRTAEGKFALLTLFIPAGIILFRSMYFYQVDSLLVAMLSMAAFLGARQAATFPESNPRISAGLELLSLPLILVFAIATTNAFAPHLPVSLIAPLFAVAYTLPALDLLIRTKSASLTTGIGVSISLFVSLSFIWGVAADPTAMTAILCLCAGTILTLSGIVLRDRMAILGGTVTVIGSLSLGFEALLAFVLASSWIDLAVFGALAIALGSLLDRHGVSINLRLASWFDGLKHPQRETALDD